MMEEDYGDYKSRAESAEANLMKAAAFGKQLLEDKSKLESRLEESQNENVNLKSQLGSLTHKWDSLTLQMDSQTTKAESDMSSLVKQHWGQIKELKSQLEESRANEESLKCLHQDVAHQLEALKAERRLQQQQKHDKLNLTNDDHSKDDLLDSLNQEILDLQEHKRSSECRIRELETDMELLQGEVTLKNRENGELKEALEEKEVELMGYLQNLQNNREVQNIDDSMEMLPSALNHNSKGNSLFSEVEDRRTIVESKLSSLTAKNVELKNMYDEKVQQLNRIKFQNMTLLNLTAAASSTSTGGGSGTSLSAKGTKTHIAKLEEELSYERKINKNLSEQLEAIKPSKEDEKFRDYATTTAERGDPQQQQQQNQQHDMKSSEYSYLSSMLEKKSTEVNDLKERLRLQMRSTLEESDTLRDF